jgi:hypothetical protein
MRARAPGSVLVALVVLSGCADAEAGGFFSGGGGTASALGLWSGHVNAPEAAVYDNFADSSLDAAWTEYDPENRITVTEGADRLLIEDDGTASNGFSGVSRAWATGDQVITIHGAVRCATWDGTGSLGLFVAEDLSAAPTTANTAGVLMNCNGPSLVFNEYSNYETFSAQNDTEDGFGPPVSDVWLRLCVDDDTDDDVTALYSATGRDWHATAAVSFAALAVNPPVDILVGCNDVSDCRVDLYREDSTADCFLPIGGD